MKFKKVLTAALSLFLLAAIPQTTSATPIHQPPNPAEWNILVLILPDIAPKGYSATPNVAKKAQLQNSLSLSQAEIDKVTQLAENLEKNWSTGFLHLNVDVKVDYEDINSLYWDRTRGFALSSLDLQSQLDRNVPEGKYASVLVVYAGSDGNVDFSTNNMNHGRSQSSNNASFSSLPLRYENHNIPAFSVSNPEQVLLLQLLNSVWSDVVSSNNSVRTPSNFFDSNHPENNKNILMDYMTNLEKDKMGSYWKDFLSK